MKKTILFFIALLFIANISYAQELLSINKKEFLIKNQPDSGAWKALAEAEKLFKLHKANAQKAANLLIKADLYNPELAKLKYNLGLCYLYAPEKSKSAKYFEEAIRLNEFVTKEVRFLLAKAYQLNGEFDKAIAAYESYKQAVAPSELPKIESKIDFLILECSKGKEFMAIQKRCYIDNLGSAINTEYNEYNPFFDVENQKLLFTSQRENTTGEKINKYDNNYYEDIFESEFANETWNTSQNLGKIFSTKNNDALVGLNSSATKAFIYKGLENGGDLFISTKKITTWSKPISLGNSINGKKSKENSATLTNDDSTLYFTSNREGGFGGFDIYVSYKKSNGKWDTPQNLGFEINSPADELSVCLSHDNQTLYFASNGLAGCGGYDIFKLEKNENGSWSNPINFGSPINLATNQLSYYPLPDNKTAYYTSENENSLGFLDIYKITFLGDEKPSYQTVEDNYLSFLELAPPKIELFQPVLSTVLSGKIISKRTKFPISAIIEIVDKEKNEVIYSEKSNLETGMYEISLPAGKNYSISVKSDEYMFASDNIEVQKSVKFQRFVKNFELSPIEIGAAIVLKNVFFDSNASILRSESYAELNVLSQLLKNNSTIKVEISGHTDNKGSAFSNKKLSTERAIAVVNYLVNTGIDKNRIVSAGYGHDKPVADNKTPEGRQINRRVEAKIISLN